MYSVYHRTIVTRYCSLYHSHYYSYAGTMHCIATVHRIMYAWLANGFILILDNYNACLLLKLQYGSDKPDTRKDRSDPTKLNFLWITDFPLFSKLSDGSCMHDTTLVCPCMQCMNTQFKFSLRICTGILGLVETIKQKWYM